MGIFNKIGLVLLLVLTIGCKKEQQIDVVKNSLIAEGKALIKQNSTILLDSLEMHDMSPVNKDGRLKPLKVALLDSVGINERFSRETLKCSTFKLEESDFSNFHSPYRLNLVKKEISESQVLFVSFSNLEIKKDLANIVVMKTHGIGSATDRYYFEKQNNKWVFARKREISRG
ncbi:hypothetical protein [Flavobacterium sp. FlaQc-47]|uniref:hypothetical protein n=1 Tax=Flavobacterium sp. FlaQc-47 TaxID=3374180 RepID=UPI003756C914